MSNLETTIRIIITLIISIIIGDIFSVFLLGIFNLPFYVHIEDDYIANATRLSNYFIIFITISSILIFIILSYFSLIIPRRKIKEQIEIREKVSEIYIEDINSTSEALAEIRKIESYGEFGGPDCAGIYMWYVDSEVAFESDVFPIYIGRAVNCRKRWDQHRKAMKMAYYNQGNQTTKYLKLSHFLKRKNLSLSSVKFCILEKSSIEDLNNKEKEWINKYKANILGFNAIK